MVQEKVTLPYRGQNTPLLLYSLLELPTDFPLRSSCRQNLSVSTIIARPVLKGAESRMFRSSKSSTIDRVVSMMDLLRQSLALH